MKEDLSNITFYQWFTRRFDHINCNVEKAAGVIGKMLNQKIEPGTVEFSKIVWGWVQSGHIDFKVFHYLISDYTLNDHGALVDVYAKTKKVD